MAEERSRDISHSPPSSSSHTLSVRSESSFHSVEEDLAGRKSALEAGQTKKRPKTKREVSFTYPLVPSVAERGPEGDKAKRRKKTHLPFTSISVPKLSLRQRKHDEEIIINKLIAECIKTGEDVLRNREHYQTVVEVIRRETYGVENQKHHKRMYQMIRSKMKGRNRVLPLSIDAALALFRASRIGKEPEEGLVLASTAGVVHLMLESLFKVQHNRELARLALEDCVDEFQQVRGIIIDTIGSSTIDKVRVELLGKMKKYYISIVDYCDFIRSKILADYNQRTILQFIKREEIADNTRRRARMIVFKTKRLHLFADMENLKLTSEINETISVMLPQIVRLSEDLVNPVLSKHTITQEDEDKLDAEVKRMIQEHSPTQEFKDGVIKLLERIDKVEAKLSSLAGQKGRGRKESQQSRSPPSRSRPTSPGNGKHGQPRQPRKPTRSRQASRGRLRSQSSSRGPETPSRRASKDRLVSQRSRDTTPRGTRESRSGSQSSNLIPLEGPAAVLLRPEYKDSGTQTEPRPRDKVADIFATSLNFIGEKYNEPLWNPTECEICDVGYIDSSGRFVRLFNSRLPNPISEKPLGPVKIVKTKLRRPTPAPRKGSRKDVKKSYPLLISMGVNRSYMCVEDAKAYKLDMVGMCDAGEWFKKNAKNILDHYQKDHSNLYQTNLIMVTGKFDARYYALLINFTEPARQDEEIFFHKFRALEAGKRWGKFATKDLVTVVMDKDDADYEAYARKIEAGKPVELESVSNISRVPRKKLLTRRYPKRPSVQLNVLRLKKGSFDVV